MLRENKLGEGTFGIVYSATSPDTHNKYAVKRNLVEEGTSFIGVLREVDVLNKLRNHPHIVKLEKVAFGQPFAKGCFSPLVGKDRNDMKDDAIHFVFDKATQDLHKFVHHTPCPDFALVKRYMTQFLLGVEYMHAMKIIHRDLKPSNLLIFNSPQGASSSGSLDKDALDNPNVVKICDFGLAKPYTYQGDQTPNTVTSWYRAPEIALYCPTYDYKTDVWSAGCVLFEMIAKKAFVHGASDENDDVISRILGALPQALTVKQLREIVKSNRWRTTKLKATHNPKNRLPLAQRLGLSKGGIEQFEKKAGKIDLFCDLLTNMLQFDWEKRYTITQCLDHPFFADQRNLIEATRTKFPANPVKEQPIIVRDCIERHWMSLVATDIFNNRDTLKWYNHRALFQAMDLFDRYLYVMFHCTEIPENAIESEFKGLIHDKFETELRFVTCMYLSVKFFNSIHYPVPFDAVASEVYRTKEAKLIAEQFEGAFVKNCLEYNIYRPTVYEIADEFGERLSEEQIRDLIILYSMNNTINDVLPSQLYKFYRDKLKDKTVDDLFTVVVTTE